MEKIPKMNGVLEGNFCETCRNIPQKTNKKLFYQEELFNKSDGTSYK